MLKRLTMMMGALAILGSAALAQDYTLVAGHQLAVDTPFDQGLHRFAELVEEKTDGQVVVEVHPAAEIGSELELFEGMMQGTADAAIVAPGSIAEFVEETNLLSFPFLVDSREMRDRVIESDAFETIADIVEERTGNVIAGVFGGGIRNMFFTHEVTSLEEMQGEPFRVQPSRILTDSFGAIGLEPTVVDYAELYNALQQGVVTGAENESVYIESQAFYEPAPYLVRTQHEVTIRPLVISGITLDRLPDDLADAVLEAAAEASEYAREIEAEQDDAAKERLLNELGMTEHVVDTDPMIEAVQPVWQQYAEQWGLEAELEEIDSLR